MSFFKKLFGGRSFADQISEANTLFDEGRWAEARLAYERAVDGAGGGDDTAPAEKRMNQCLDSLAKARVEEAERLLENGHYDLAEAELQNALELAASDAIRIDARRRIETLEKEDAVRQQADVPDEMSDEDRWALLAGNWEEDQLDEYDDYGDEFREAMLAMHDDEGEKALAGLEAISDAFEGTVYLWLEIGRARALCEDWEGAEKAIRTFLGELEEDEGGVARMSARASLAGLRDRADDEEGAMAELEAAMEEFPDQTTPFLMMGRFLFDKEYFEEAADVLQAGTQLLDPDQTDWRYLEQLGLALAESGELERAAAYLDEVILFFVGLRRHDRPLEYPPQTATVRAAIHEEAGELDKAADLYRTLADGGDTANHLEYHREAARLLLALDLRDDARRMLTRALALVEDDQETLDEIESQLAELE